MSIPKVRCGLTPEGHVEAAMIRFPNIKLVMHHTTGAIISKNVSENSDDFRILVREGRKHCADPVGLVREATRRQTNVIRRRSA